MSEWTIHVRAVVRVQRDPRAHGEALTKGIDLRPSRIVSFEC